MAFDRILFEWVRHGQGVVGSMSTSFACRQLFVEDRKQDNEPDWGHESITWSELHGLKQAHIDRIAFALGVICTCIKMVLHLYKQPGSKLVVIAYYLPSTASTNLSIVDPYPFGTWETGLWELQSWDPLFPGWRWIVNSWALWYASNKEGGT